MQHYEDGSKLFSVWNICVLHMRGTQVTPRLQTGGDGEMHVVQMEGNQSNFIESMDFVWILTQ